MEGFDDSPQWYWAASRNLTLSAGDPGRAELAGDRFVVACGQRELWTRVREEIHPGERCGWQKIGPADGSATLADCVAVMITAREHYGASFNRVVLELAQVPAFAAFLRDSPNSLHELVSNPLTPGPLPREPYDHVVVKCLRDRVAATLRLPADVDT